MFIILSIYTKNSNSLTNFLKFFYKLELIKSLKLEFDSIQRHKKKKFFFVSVLQSPHVNKKSQEQFEYHIFKKQLKIHVFQMIKLLSIWKKVDKKLFYDINIKIHFLLNDKSCINVLPSKIDYDNFISKFCSKIELCSSTTESWKFLAIGKNFHVSNVTKQTSLRLIDIQGETLLKNFFCSN